MVLPLRHLAIVDAIVAAIGPRQLHEAGAWQAGGALGIEPRWRPAGRRSAATRHAGAHWLGSAPAAGTTRCGRRSRLPTDVRAAGTRSATESYARGIRLCLDLTAGGAERECQRAEASPPITPNISFKNACSRSSST